MLKDVLVYLEQGHNTGQRIGVAAAATTASSPARTSPPTWPATACR